jgi:hypothetical protein
MTKKKRHCPIPTMNFHVLRSVGSTVLLAAALLGLLASDAYDPRRCDMPLNAIKPPEGWREPITKAPCRELQRNRNIRECQGSVQALSPYLIFNRSQTSSLLKKMNFFQIE